MSATAEKKTAEDVEESLQPDADIKEWTIGMDSYAKTYTQKPLPVFGKLELMSLLGRTLDGAIKDGLNVADLMDVPDEGSFTSDEEAAAQASAFVEAVAKLLIYSPDLAGNMLCIFMNVPKGERTVIKEIMALPEDEGGLGDDQFVGMLETFYAQNAEVFRRFFAERIRPMFDRIQKRREAAEKKREEQEKKSSRSSSSSSPTRQRTPKG